MHQESLSLRTLRVATWPEKAKVPSPRKAADAQLNNSQAESNLLLFPTVGPRLGEIPFKHGQSDTLPSH
jgi:hypothetical protein